MPLVFKCAEMDHFRINNNKKLFSVPFDKMMRWRGKELLDKVESIQLAMYSSTADTHRSTIVQFRVFLFSIKDVCVWLLPSLLTLNCVCWFDLVFERFLLYLNSRNWNFKIYFVTHLRDFKDVTRVAWFIRFFL